MTSNDDVTNFLKTADLLAVDIVPPKIKRQAKKEEDGDYSAHHCSAHNKPKRCTPSTA